MSGSAQPAQMVAVVDLAQQGCGLDPIGFGLFKLIAYFVSTYFGTFGFWTYFGYFRLICD